MKLEFNSCAHAIKWIMNNASTEVDFQVFREELDLNYVFTGRFFIHISDADRQMEVQITRA